VPPAAPLDAGKGKAPLANTALSAYTLPRPIASDFDRQHDLMATNGTPPVVPPTLISINDLKTHCMTCSVRELCLPVGLKPEAMHQLDQLVSDRQKRKRGEPIFGAGEPFEALYAIRLGTCKTTMLAEDGREQVTGYHMPGDLLGLDGIGHDRHGCQAIALEDAEVCVLPFGHLEDLARRLPPLQKNLHRVLSREIIRDHNVMLLLGSMRSDERLAVFLLNLSDRYRDRGYSATEFVLRMTREEIGSYLGLKLETVSRLFSRFQQDGLIQIQGRAIKLLDTAALRQLAGQHG